MLLQEHSKSCEPHCHRLRDQGLKRVIHARTGFRANGPDDSAQRVAAPVRVRRPELELQGPRPEKGRREGDTLYFIPSQSVSQSVTFAWSVENEKHRRMEGNSPASYLFSQQNVI